MAMTRCISTYLSLISVAVFAGCIYIPESGIQARQNFNGNLATGAEKNNAAFAAWLEEQTELLVEAPADAATFDDFAPKIASAALYTTDTLRVRAEFLKDREETRAEIKTWKKTPLEILAEYERIAAGNRQAEQLSAEELEAVRRAKATLAGSGGQ